MISRLSYVVSFYFERLSHAQVGFVYCYNTGYRILCTCLFARCLSKTYLDFEMRCIW